ncbi:MAG: hypothetical protein P8Y42_04110 [Exilibacterium sp.]
MVSISCALFLLSAFALFAGTHTSRTGIAVHTCIGEHSVLIKGQLREQLLVE